MDPLGIQPAVLANQAPLWGQRRRRQRIKTRIPAYASFNSNSDSPGVDLSEILDISEDGIAVQASPPLALNRHLNLRLHLSETKTDIQTTGYVVWSDSTGEAGIRFPDLPDATRRQLREWLSRNTLASSTRMASVRDEESKAASQAAESMASGAIGEALSQPAVPDFTTRLAALAAVEREVWSLGASLDAALPLIADRAKTFTRSSGAAIALIPKENSNSNGNSASASMPQVMICRANAGAGVPPIGTRLQAGTGFSGECVRTGQLLCCDDAESNVLVDREICRQLGIRSILAAPVRSGQAAIGLVEVFSPLPHAFDDDDGMALQRLADATSAALARVRHRAPKKSAPPTFSKLDHVDIAAAPKEAALPQTRQPEGNQSIPVPRSQLVLLIAVAATLALVLGFLMAPWVDAKWSRDTPVTKETVLAGPPAPASKPARLKSASEAKTLDELRQFAEQGDATAQFALGTHYATGSEVKQNYAEAVRWFTKAAEQGHVIAQATLGAYYWAGRGVRQDLNKAYFWSILARANGDEASKYRAAVLTSRMTRAQAAAAQQEADEWLKHHQIASNSALLH